MIPGILITKSDGNTGVVRPTAEGILAILATASGGTANQPAGYGRSDKVATDFVAGVLPEAAAYIMSISKKPIVAVKTAGSTAAAYSSVTHSGAGTSVVTAGVTVPLDFFDVVVKIVAGGTIGVAGITYQESLNGGVDYGPVRALGTANSIAVLDGRGNATGVTLAFAAGTVLANQTESVQTTPAESTNGDIVSALEALRTSNLRWEAILIAGVSSPTILATVTTWLIAREGEGKFRIGFHNTAARTSAQTEAQFKTALDAAWGASSSIRDVVCADFCDIVSPIRGVALRRPVAWAVAARAMEVDVSEDLAYVARGPLQSVSITDSRSNPKWHDEASYPGLDDSRFTALRTFDNREGVYVNNPLLFSPAGSDYVYLQYARCMNLACEIAFEVLTGRLSQGVQKNSSGKILEQDAQEIEGLVQAPIDGKLVIPKRVSASKLVLSREDDLSSNAGATVTGEVQMVPLSYIKKFSLEAKFVKKIAVAV